ncbi:MAG: NYN domain-containing protein [Nitrospira sp.]|nr:MAG: NYN domain-containing protein [Nitrospira sp.]
MPLNNNLEEGLLKVIVFFDGQNIYHLAKSAWAPVPAVANSPYCYPSYDVSKLATYLVNLQPRRALTQTRFYTGVPNVQHDPFWNGFWSNKLRFLGSRGIYVYRGRVNPGGQEKGVDVSLAIDLINLTYEKQYDVAILVSQDHDFGPAVKLAKQIAQDQGRQLRFESAFPCNLTNYRNIPRPRGVPGTIWSFIDKNVYDSCFDPTDYRRL